MLPVFRTNQASQETRREMADWVKEISLTWPGGRTFSTADLLGEFPPEDRKQAARILIDLARYELTEYATQGEPKPGAGYNTGKLIRPWVWHPRQPGKAVTERAPNQLDRIEAKIDQLLKGR